MAERLGIEWGSVTDLYLPQWSTYNLPAIHVLLICMAAFFHARNPSCSSEELAGAPRDCVIRCGCGLSRVMSMWHGDL